MTDHPFGEQFSPTSRTALLGAQADLVSALERHASELAGMAGRSAEVERVFELNEAVGAALRAWADATFEHTGTFPLEMPSPDGDDEPWPEVLDPIDDEPSGSAVVSVVSRVDLHVTDAAALLAAGRAAHCAEHPQERLEDAAVAVPGSAAAMRAVVGGVTRSWAGVPGIEVLSGSRAFVVPGEPTEDEIDRSLLEELAPPPGQVALGEQSL